MDMSLSKKIILAILLIVTFAISFSLKEKVGAITLDECQNKNVNDLSAGDRDWCLNVGFPQIINSLAPAQAKNKQDLAGLQSQLTSITQKITAMTNQLNLFNANIAKQESDLAYTKTIFEEKTAEQYKF